MSTNTNVNINGFVFNCIGDLISKPENTSLELLEKTLETLHSQGERIKASRIQHAMNVIYFNQPQQGI